MLYCGNIDAAKTRSILDESNVTHVVNCTTDHPLFFEGAGIQVSGERSECERATIPCGAIIIFLLTSIQYLRFPIAEWWRKAPTRGDHGQLLRFLSPLFDFVLDALKRDKSVMVHCLAGAHRAGTATCSLLMRITGASARTAVYAAQQRRSIISPIGSFSDLLQRIDVALSESGVRARAVNELRQAPRSVAGEGGDPRAEGALLCGF